MVSGNLYVRSSGASVDKRNKKKTLDRRLSGEVMVLILDGDLDGAHVEENIYIFFLMISNLRLPAI